MAHRINHKKPIEMLERDYLNLDKESLHEHLVDLILAERDGNDSSAFLYAKLNPLLGKIKLKRIEVAKHYKNYFGDVSSILLYGSIPSKSEWPGIIGLIKTIGEESYFIE